MQRLFFAKNSDPLSTWKRRTVAGVGAILLLVLAAIGILFFRQHAMIYHPRGYDSSFARALPPDGVEIHYSVAAINYCAFYVPGSEPPKRIWVAFCGNGSLALDWTTILRPYPQNGDAFLLIDYPGYGKNGGYATIASTRASADAALRALVAQLKIDEQRIRLCAIGHSLGAAVALDFARQHPVEKVVLIAPFTTLRDEAATVVGRWLACLLIESYDNRADLAQTVKRNPAVRVAIFHGTDDDVIPVRMGQELARQFPKVEFFSVKGADHVSVLNLAHDKIVAWMNL